MNTLNMEQRYCLASREIVAETIDDEVIILNLHEGIYYSLQQVASVIWDYVDQGASITQIIAQVSARYVVEQAYSTRCVTAFIAELESEQLIKVDNSNRKRFSMAIPSYPERQPFQTPVINRYSDMQQLLVLDPILEDEESESGQEAGVTASAVAI